MKKINKPDAFNQLPLFHREPILIQEGTPMFGHDEELERIRHLLEAVIYNTSAFQQENRDRFARIEHELHHLLHPKKRLSTIHIKFRKGHKPMPVPAVLTQVGQTVTAVVTGSDQFGNPWTGAIPTPTFTSDDTSSAVVSFDPSTGVVTAVANGTANITASLTTAENKSLTDTEAVIVNIPVEAPVLSAIRVDFQ